MHVDTRPLNSAKRSRELFDRLGLGANLYAQRLEMPLGHTTGNAASVGDLSHVKDCKRCQHDGDDCQAAVTLESTGE